MDIGTPDTNPNPEVPAMTPGILPPTRGGLLMIVPGAEWCANEDCVAIEDVEFDRVGDEGRIDPNGASATGEGAIEWFDDVR